LLGNAEIPQRCLKRHKMREPERRIRARTCEYIREHSILAGPWEKGALVEGGKGFLSWGLVEENVFI